MCKSMSFKILLYKPDLYDKIKQIKSSCRVTENFIWVRIRIRAKLVRIRNIASEAQSNAPFALYSGQSLVAETLG
jgi:hypothetical protein